MILQLFSRKFYLAQFGIILAFLILMLNREVVIYEPQGFGPLYHLVYYLLNGSTTAVYTSFITLIILEGLLLQLINSSYRLVMRNNFIILLLWPILLFSNPSTSSINPVLIAAVISTWALFRLLSISNTENTLANLYTAGFLFSTASLVYGNMLWFLAFLIISLLLLALFKGYELMVSIIAFATPYVFLFVYGFVVEQDFIFWNQFHFNIGQWTFYEYGPQLWISTATTLIIIGFSIFAISKLMVNLFSKLIQIRKLTAVIFTMLLVSLGMQFLSGPWWFSHPTLIFIPLSILLATFLSEQKKTRIYDIIILIIMLLEIAQLYFTRYA